MPHERKFPRLEIDAVTELRESSVDPKMVTPDAHVQNVSTGGAFIATEMLFPIGSLVEFNMYLPNVTELVEVRAIVRHVQSKPKAGMGVEFVSIAVEHIQALERLVGAYADEAKPPAEPQPEG